MKEQLERINSLKAELKNLLPMKDEYQQRLDQKFMLEWNYNSNHIEGNTLTYGETELLLIQGEAVGNHNIREYEEMKAHDVAISYVKEAAADAEHELTELFIRELNEIILKEPFYKKAETSEGQPTRKKVIPGQYKTTPNNVKTSTGEIFFFASVEETPAKMNELVNWYRATDGKEEHPLVVAAYLHYKFVRIHPFDDGNGRVARLLMNYHLLKNDFPPVIIKTEDKNGYFSALRRADVGEYDPFIAYMANELEWSLEITHRAAQGKNVEDETDWKKKVDLVARTLEQKQHAEIEQIRRIEDERKRAAVRNTFLLKKEFFRIYTPLTTFFENAKVHVLVKHRSAPSQLSWRELKDTSEDKLREVVEGKDFENAILMRVEFSRFKYGPDFSFKKSYSLDFKEGQSFLFNAQELPGGKKIYNLNESIPEADLRILKESAELLMKRIEDESV